MDTRRKARLFPQLPLTSLLVRVAPLTVAVGMNQEIFVGLVVYLVCLDGRKKIILRLLPQILAAILVRLGAGHPEIAQPDFTQFNKINYQKLAAIILVILGMGTVP